MSGMLFWDTVYNCVDYLLTGMFVILLGSDSSLKVVLFNSALYLYWYSVVCCVFFSSGIYQSVGGW